MSGKQTFEEFFFKLAVLTGVVVLLFSVFNKYDIIMIILRPILAFLVIFILGKSFIYIWEKLSSPNGKKNQSTKIDYVSGEINTYGSKQEDRQKEEHVPGQINSCIKDGLPDADTKAEMVRKMGWEVDQ